jgi:hypothetical protein
VDTNQARQLLQQFEDCSLPKGQWTHQAHFVMALWYCSQLPLPAAVSTIKEGIKKYNVSIGGANTDHSGYHETITMFYIRLIVDYLLQAEPGAGFEMLLPELFKQPFMLKDYPLQYYSKDVLMSKEARLNWVKPDLTIPVNMMRDFKKQ